MLFEKIRNYHLILASGSPRRRELLRSAGFVFDVVDGVMTDETYPEELMEEAIPVYLAKKKSMAFSGRVSAGMIVITADTIVSQQGEVLHKPGSAAEAFATLQKISGNSHYVHTGVCLRSADMTAVFSASTEVRFGVLSDEEIQYYIETYKPYDKAGAYGIQEWIGYVGVEEIRGSYFNVMGLPIHKLYRELEKII
ncbi:MAG: Maf family nucleotide pyrophosphatase [Bacteroidales bacterium]|nr:Maf family nucleotide pyrophosphatase [Bacteroidales bacterium]